MKLASIARKRAHNGRPARHARPPHAPALPALLHLAPPPARVWRVLAPVRARACPPIALGPEAGLNQAKQAPSRSRHEDLLRQMVPPVQLQDPLVVLGERPERLRLPEDPCARPDEPVVEHALVERPLPALPVDGVQRPTARLHPLEPVLPALARGRHVVHQGRPAHAADRGPAGLLGLHRVVRLVVARQAHAGHPARPALALLKYIASAARRI